MMDLARNGVLVALQLPVVDIDYQALLQAIVWIGTALGAAMLTYTQGSKARRKENEQLTSENTELKTRVLENTLEFTGKLHDLERNVERCQDDLQEREEQVSYWKSRSKVLDEQKDQITRGLYLTISSQKTDLERTTAALSEKSVELDQLKSAKQQEAGAYQSQITRLKDDLNAANLALAAAERRYKTRYGDE